MLTFAKVLEDMPLDMAHAGQLWQIEVDPNQTDGFPLTQKVPLIDLSGQEIEHASGTVSFFSDGRLGTLHGGLLSVRDYRQPMTQDDVDNVRKSLVEEQLALKRLDS